MGHRRSTNGVERRVPGQDSKDRRPTRMEKLQRNYAAISDWKSPQKNNIGKTVKRGGYSVLRDHQAGFRQDRGRIDQFATLRIIVEQSTEFDSSL